MDMMINGQPADVADFMDDSLAQVVLISLFSWRKSNEDDGVVAPNRQGWWGDTFAQVTDDRIGSRLWLLQREKVLPSTMRKAEAYTKEALQWLIDDAVIAKTDVSCERYGTDGIALNVVCYKPDDTQALNARFQNVWG